MKPAAVKTAAANIPTTGRPVTLDSLDVALVSELRKDGRLGNRALAATLDVTEITIANRLKRLEQHAAMRVVAIADMFGFQFSEVAFVLLRVEGRPLHEVAAEVAKVPETFGVTICGGRFDLVVATLARDREHLARLVNATLNRIPGVAGAAAQLVLKMHKYESKWASLVAEHPPLPAVEACANADELDVRLIKLLQRDGRESNRRIADQLKVSEGTVRMRIKRLLAENLIRIQAISDVQAFGFGAHAYIGIQADGSSSDTLGARLSALPDIAVVAQTMGAFDFIVVAATPDFPALVELVVQRLSATPGVRRSETLVSFGTQKHCYTWGYLGAASSAGRSKDT